VALKCQTDTNAVIIAVEDSGIGIPEDKLERIFDEYYQVDTHGTQRMGVGLGLAIVKEVARLLAFTVKIQSKLRQGTQVLLSIPLRHRVLTRARGSEPMAAHAPAVEACKPRLVLVEDNDGVRLATELFLKVEGHPTLSARTMAEAEALLEGILPGDIIIADYHLDGGNNGFDLIMRLRGKLGYDVPGIVLSGDLTSVRRSIKGPIAACHFLGKPVDTAALLEAIADLSSTSRQDIAPVNS
jgi:CheY-like chemotaxis protein